MYTIVREVNYSESIKKSDFTGYLTPVSNPGEAKEFINSVSRKHKDASHNCWAYITGLGGETCHCSDAGEPSGTAGKPILSAMQRFEISNAVLVVIRYFGGVKLGIRGLIEAYRHIAEETIKIACLKEMILKDFYVIVTKYSHADKLRHALQKLNVKIIDIDYAEDVTLRVSAIVNSELGEYLANVQESGLLSFQHLKTEL